MKTLPLVSRTVVPLLISFALTAAPATANNTPAAPGGTGPGGAVHRPYEKAIAMTDFERAEARLNAMSRGENPRAPHVSSTRSSKLTDAVDGRRSPERFFRYELFDELLMALCAENAHHDAARLDWAPALRSVGVDGSTFWPALESSIGSYRSAHCVRHGVAVRARTASVQIKTVRGDAEVQVRVDLQQCRSRAAAFGAAERAIGKATLAKVLYGVVAPVTSLSYSTSDEHHVDQMLYMEGGCK
jgi:hypothetical protein